MSGTRKRPAARYSSFSEMPDDALRNFANDLAEVGRIGAVAAKRARADRRAMTPRGLSKEAAAEYAGCESLSSFDDWVRRGIMPPKIPGTNKWDRKAIDAALDRLSGFQPTIALEQSAYDKWKAERDARSSQGHPHDLQETRGR